MQKAMGSIPSQTGKKEKLDEGRKEVKEGGKNRGREGKTNISGLD